MHRSYAGENFIADALPSDFHHSWISTGYQNYGSNHDTVVDWNRSRR